MQAVPPGRRRVLQLAAGLALASQAGFARAAPRHANTALAGTTLAGTAPPPRAGASIMVAGPDGGELERWGRVLAPVLARFMSPGGATHVSSTGGVDGVTGANQFDARAAPDGSTLLLVPGAAALAWLAGDPRAQFDAAHWVPVMAGVTPGVVAGRVGTNALARGNGVRIGAASPAGPDMAALLGIELLGARPIPSFGLTDAAAARDAFLRREVDLVFLHGRQVAERLADLRAAGAQPLFALGAVGETGSPERDPLFPDVPNLPELYTAQRGSRPAGMLYRCLDGGGSRSAARFRPGAATAYPGRDGGAVAAGRHTCRWDAGTAGGSGGGLGPAAGRGRGPPPSTTEVAADAPALLELRRWLATRFNWRAG